MCTRTQDEKITFSLFSSPFPNANAIYLFVALPMAERIHVNIVITLATTLYMPKSDTPSVASTILLVYKVIAITNNWRPYNSKVFFAIRVLSEELEVIAC